MDQRVAAYVRSIEAHGRARDAAVDLIKRIKSVGDSLLYRTANFMAVNYDLVTPGLQRAKIEDAFNMARWPSAPQLEDALRNWHASFVAMHQAWANISARERPANVMPPPGMMVAG